MGSSLATLPLALEYQPCRCCRDLPASLSCARWGTAVCPVCGWQGDYADLDDAPESCPVCGGSAPEEAD